MKRNRNKREKKQEKIKVKIKDQKVLKEWRKIQVLTGESYFRRFATSHAQAIKAFTVKSPGTTLASMDPSQWIDRKTPVPAPAATPVGPYKLSIHPRTGSWYVDITENSIKCPIKLIFMYIWPTYTPAPTLFPFLLSHFLAFSFIYHLPICFYIVRCCFCFVAVLKSNFFSCPVNLMKREMSWKSQRENVWYR